LVIALLIAVHAGVGFWAGGHTDAYYLRFATPAQRSLILGTSRAAQGLVPAVLNAELERAGYAGPMFNFAFTNMHSPYGPAYRRAVQHKLDPNTKNGLFLLSVDPWSLSAKEENAGNPALFRESELPISTLDCFTCAPNWQYLRQHYSKAWGSILLQPWLTPELFLHRDGWLEVTVPMAGQDVARRTQEKITQYQQLTNAYVPSPLRKDALLALIQWLQKHGEVVLVRLPVGQELLAIEQAYWPGFTTELQAIAQKQGVAYHDLTTAFPTLQFTDGNHLYQASAKKVSKALAKRLLQPKKSSVE
jgi:hypothetical protein